MKNFLTNPTKKRVIREIKRILYDHPRYRADSENVQNKFSFDERPQRGVIVNGTSADRVRLSADNYVGRLSSYVMLTNVENFPGTSLEWVRENYPLLEQYSARRDVFPSPPGTYVLEITRLPDEAHSVPGLFTVDPVLDVDNEPLIIFSSSGDNEAQLSHDQIYPNSVRLWLDSHRALLPDVDFSVDYETGAVVFLKETPAGSDVHADYKYKTGLQGPFPFEYEASDETAIPGAVLAFGDRAQLGDRLAVKVQSQRSDVSEIFGGKFEVTFELVAFSRDAEDREKLSDYIVAKVLETQNRLGFEGLELLDISPGGENEDVYNPEIDDYYYESSISLTLRVDWESYFALPADVWRAEMTSQSSESQSGFLDGSFFLDQLKTGDLARLAGVNVVIGKGISFDRTR